jgi:hypothetical protein
VKERSKMPQDDLAGVSTREIATDAAKTLIQSNSKGFKKSSNPQISLSTDAPETWPWLLKQSQAAALLNCSEDHITNLTDEGILTGVDIASPGAARRRLRIHRCSLAAMLHPHEKDGATVGKLSSHAENRSDSGHPQLQPGTRAGSDCVRRIGGRGPNQSAPTQKTALPRSQSLPRKLSSYAEILIARADAKKGVG